MCWVEEHQGTRRLSAEVAQEPEGILRRHLRLSRQHGAHGFFGQQIVEIPLHWAVGRTIDMQPLLPG
jgi:hypothetical protein